MDTVNLVISAHLLTEKTRSDKKSIFLTTTKLKSVLNSMIMDIVHTELDVNLFIASKRIPRPIFHLSLKITNKTWKIVKSGLLRMLTAIV